MSPCSPSATAALLLHLGEIFDLQHVVVSVATQDTVPLIGHIDVVLDRFGGDGQPPAGGDAGQGGDAGMGATCPHPCQGWAGPQLASTGEAALS